MAFAIPNGVRARNAPALSHPDSEKLARAIDLRRRVRAGDPHLERDVLAIIESGAARARLEADKRMAQLEAQARATGVQSLDADHFVSTAEFDIAAVEARLFEPLVHARLEERRRLRELRRFKLDHNLERDASYAESVLQPAANLALLVAAEAAANALLLQTASAGGYVGGFLIAVVMSLVTVAMGALFAGLLGIRLIRRCDLRFRILGGAIFSGAFAFAGLWAYALAKYRDAAMAAAAGFAATSGRGKKRALAANAANSLFGPADGPVLGFSSLESLALVVLGFLVFVLAAMKGAGGRGGFTDSYWGYKPRHAAHRAADEAYQDEQEDYFEALEEAVENARADLDDAAEKAAAEAAQARGLCDEALSVIPAAHAALNAWRDARADLMRRMGLPAPQDEPFFYAPGAADDLHRLRDDLDRRRAADAAAANAARRALKQRLEDAQNRLAARIADAEREADRRLGEELAYLKADEGKLV